MSDWFEPVAQDMGDLTVSCIESGKGCVLVEEGILPLEFFDLSTRVAGELLHELGKYGIRMAAIVPRPQEHSEAFQEFVREANRRGLTRFFSTREEAEAWLVKESTD